jgi:hypothetical protein
LGKKEEPPASQLGGFLLSHQIRVICSPFRLGCLVLSDQLVGSGDGGGNLAISDLGLLLQGG